MARTPRRSFSDGEFPVFASFRDFKGKSLTWFQPRMLLRYHELSDGSQLFSTLRWLKVFSSLAKVESSEGAFTFKRGGFLKPYVSLRDADLGTDFAMLNLNFFSGGTLAFADGRQFTFTSSSFWGYEWCFKDENGSVMFSIRKRASLKECADVVLSPQAKRDKRLMAAIAVAWYAIVMANEETAVAVAASA
ncbi:MAG: hypothetical protein A3K76_00995 [Euryarchaeota archaeon RBG_13_57_23]|nr:MAG: hypothetical protein A3K76_00995 [Euryarchaeota archaeon RBG_13_57_23]